MTQKERIIQYVLNTPCNNNRQILESLLSDIDLQPDWNQNDETKKDYVKGRTHWVEEKAVLEETTFTIEESGDSFAFGNFPVTLSAGDICTVVYDGKTYTCTVSEFGTNIAGIGCDAFGIAFQNQPDGLCAITIFAHAGEHTISILQTTYHTLNPKYIKDMYYSEIGEGVIGTGANGWIKVTNYQAITIPKMAINGTIYENVPVDHVANRCVYYVVGGYTLEFDRMSSSMNADGLSDDDVVFYGETQIYHTIPDKFIPWEESPTADSILYTAQSLTEEQQAQARANIGADISTKMDANNPVGTGSFSMNRKAGTVIGNYSHAEGYNTTASGQYSHAEGNQTTASGEDSHAEGYRTTASGSFSHAEGYSTTASGNYPHAEGSNTTASGYSSHAEGSKTTASGEDSHAEGYSTNKFSSVFPTTNPTTDSIITAWKTKKFSVAKGKYSHVEGKDNLALDDYSHAEGYQTTASGINSHAEGYLTIASGQNSHAEGYKTTASGSSSHAEGNGTTAMEKYSHAEGSNTTASGQSSHAEGGNTQASGFYSHAEGYQTTASGNYSHAEGYKTTASKSYSHAEGSNTTASGDYSHVQGKYNIEDTSNTYADIIGNGTSDTARSNAATVDWSGNAWFAGDVYTGSTSGTNKDDGSKKLATEEYVNSSIAAAGTDISLGLTSAAVSQIIKVKAIDGSGKPTEWETANMPSGGGVSDYTELSNKPKINGVELSGDKTSADYGIGNPTDEQVASSVEAWLDAHPEATTTVQDGAITKEKIHDNAVGAHELDIDFSNNLSTLPDNPNVIKVATGWEAYVTELRQAQVYPNGVLWAFHCEAGKCYRIQPQYEYQSSREPLFTPANPDNANRINATGSAGFICDRIIAPKAGAFSTQDGYIANTWHFGLPQGLDPVYATIFNNVSTVRARAEFRCEKDFWMYWLSASDVSAEVPYIGGSAESIREIPEPPQSVLESGGWFSTSVANSATYIPPYKKSFSGYAEEKSGGETSEDSVHGIRRYVLTKDISGAVARSSRDPADYRINALLIGDSITYAASNAGLQNAWRKYISTRLNIGEIALAVSGTGIIKGAPYDFKGNAKGSEAYSEDMSGYPGIVHWVNSYLGKESTFEFPGSFAYSRNLLMKRSSIAIVALGTNDWSANSTLGSVDTIGDETTFYGAVQKTYTFLHDEVGIPSVLFVSPFKRQGWNQPNQATTPYTIYDMCHALAEIACINTDMYVLDCLDRWYLNYDDEAIRSKSFIDNVHIKPYAHHLFTIDLAKEIRAILSTKGVV